MSIPPRRALYGKLSSDVTLAGLLGTPPAGFSKSIYYEEAPQGAGFPYVVFNKQSGTPTYAMSALAMDNELWLFKAVDRSDSADVVDSIASRLDALLTDGTVNISGKTSLYLRRESDVDYSEFVDGKTYRHSGALFRFIYT